MPGRNGDRTGLYKIDAKTRQVTALATKADDWPFCFPHGTAVDSHGNVYMADLTYSAIWKISPDGKKVDVWSAHQLLNWPPSPSSGRYIGVSALALDKQEKNIYAVTAGEPMLLRIPIKETDRPVNPKPCSPAGTLYSTESRSTQTGTSTSPKCCETRFRSFLPTDRNAS